MLLLYNQLLLFHNHLLLLNNHLLLLYNHMLLLHNQLLLFHNHLLLLNNQMLLLHNHLLLLHNHLLLFHNQLLLLFIAGINLADVLKYTGREEILFQTMREFAYAIDPKKEHRFFATLFFIDFVIPNLFSESVLFKADAKTSSA